MPIYEYRCDKCSHRFEELVFSDKQPPGCPKCGAKKPKKLMSGFYSARSGNDGGGTSASGKSCAGCSSSNCASCH